MWQRRPLQLTVDEAQPRRLNVVLNAVTRDLTGGPLSILRFMNRSVHVPWSFQWHPVHLCTPPPPPPFCGSNTLVKVGGRGCSDVLERPCPVGGGGGHHPPPPRPPWTPPLLPFQCLRLTAKNLRRRLRCQEDLSLKNFGPPSAGTKERPWEEGGPSQLPLPPLHSPPAPPPPLQDPLPSTASLHGRGSQQVQQRGHPSPWRGSFPRDVHMKGEAHGGGMPAPPGPYLTADVRTACGTMCSTLLQRTPEGAGGMSPGSRHGKGAL